MGADSRCVGGQLPALSIVQTRVGDGFKGGFGRCALRIPELDVFFLGGETRVVFGRVLEVMGFREPGW